MALEANPPREVKNGNGVTTPWPFLFQFQTAGEIKVTRIVAGIETVQALGVDYTVSGGAGLAGTVTTVSFTLQTGEQLVIERVTAQTQSAVFPLNGGLPSTAVELALDKIVAVVQEYVDRTNRAVRLGIASLFSDITVPDPVAGLFLRWKADLTGLENATVVDLGALGVPVAIADGGTGATTASGARTSLGLGTAATKNTGTGATDVPTNADLAPIAGLKNKIINGEFDIWPEGTSFAAIGNGVYGPEGWGWATVGAGVVTVSRNADVPTVAQAGRLFNYSLDIQVTTADASLAATDRYSVHTPIEGFDFTQIAQRAFIVSFWMKAKKTGVYCVSAINSGADRSYVAEVTVNVADTWEFKTAAFTASPTAGTWDYTSGRGILLGVALAAGSNFQTTAASWQTGNFVITTNQANAMDNVANYVRLAGVQCEVGSVATAFDDQEIAARIKRAERYFGKTFPINTAPAQATGINTGEFQWFMDAANTGNCGRYFQYPSRMRAAPTITLYNPVAANAQIRNFTDTADFTGSSAANVSETGALIFGVGNAGNSAGDLIAVHVKANARLSCTS